VGDGCDNCPGTANHDQADGDQDGTGDACQYDPLSADADADGTPDGLDNCPDDPNPGQADADGDRVGDGCDNCPGTANHGQADGDQDGTGDACEGAIYDPARDGDADSVADVDDNCPGTANLDQADLDADGVGTACDNCPGEANPFQEDADGNLVGDHCEPLPDQAPVCLEGSVESQRLKPNIYLLVDFSGSMTEPSGGGNTRWQATTAALDALSAGMTADFNVGIGLFPAICTNYLLLLCFEPPNLCHVD
jgi:hypothetical protein